MKFSKVSLAACLPWMIFSVNALPLCGVPQPRLVCAEASSSPAVVIARLISRRAIPDENNAESYVYKLAVLKTIRGKIPEQFEVDEGNDSGRADFDWRVGRKYVLFLFHPPKEKTWAIESCGNSKPLAEAGNVLKHLEVMSHGFSRPLISGMISTDAWTTGVPGAEVVISGTHGKFKTASDRNGRFRLRVPDGNYTVTAYLKGWSFEPAILSHEDPRHLVLTNGSCAQVQLEGSRGSQ